MKKDELEPKVKIELSDHKNDLNELLVEMKPLFDKVEEEVVRAKQDLQPILKKFKTSQEVHMAKYGEITFFEAFSNLAMEGYYFSPNLPLRDVYELNALKGEAKENGFCELYELDDYRLLKKDALLIVEFAKSDWAELLEESFVGVLEDKIPFKLLLPLAFSYAESLIRRLSVKNEEDNKKQPSELIRRYISKLKETDSDKKMYRSTLIDVFTSLNKGKNMFSFQDFTKVNLQVSRHTIAHGVLPPSKWKRVDLYKVISWLAFVSMVAEE